MVDGFSTIWVIVKLGEESSISRAQSQDWFSKSSAWGERLWRVNIVEPGRRRDDGSFAAAKTVRGLF